MSTTTGTDAAARPPRLPREERRIQVLDAAREAFVAHGYHQAAMDEIADRAGVSKPVLYQHFPGKLELYLALLDTSAEALLAAVHDALESTPDNKSRVGATIEAYLDFVSESGEEYRLVFESDLMNEPEVRSRVQRANTACVALLAEVIASDTGLSSAEARLLAAGLTGMAQMSALHWLHHGGDTGRPEAARLLSSLSWRGISGFPLSHPPDDVSPGGDPQLANPTRARSEPPISM